jgi:hypothetical protein
MLEKFSVPQNNFNWLSISNKLQDYITQLYITVSQKGSSKTYFSVWQSKCGSYAIEFGKQ